MPCRWPLAAKKVKSTIEQRLHTLDVADRIFRIEIPQTPVIKIKKDGSRQTIEEKVFPGYVLVQVRAQQSPETGEWQIDDEAWQVIKNTPNVINFVGAEQRRSTGRGRGHVKPMPLSPAEVDRIFRKAQEQEPLTALISIVVIRSKFSMVPLRTLRER